MKNALFSLLIILSSSSFAALSSDTNKIRYRTNFGKCPSRAVGSMALDLVKTFEKSNSLRVVKDQIVKDKLDQKHFISDYKISYDPLKKLLNFKFDCPEPLMKVQIYKKNGMESYEAILVENGKLYDPTYEVLLRSEKKIAHDLAYLAIPVGEMDEKAQLKITKLITSTNKSFRKNISEVILNDSGDLTIIMSILGRPSSIFLGDEEWQTKMVKLQRLVKYVEKKRKVPAIINLTNSKKVVVKFNDKF